MQQQTIKDEKEKIQGRDQHLLKVDYNVVIKKRYCMANILRFNVLIITEKKLYFLFVQHRMGYNLSVQQRQLVTISKYKIQNRIFYYLPTNILN